jgi:hypothetical protein
MAGRSRRSIAARTGRPAVTQGTCNFLIAEDFYCGNPTSKRSAFCEFHEGISKIQRKSVGARLEADALAIEHQAACRLADEFDAAQERGEIAKQGQRTDLIPDEKKVATPKVLGKTFSKLAKSATREKPILASSRPSASRSQT